MKHFQKIVIAFLFVCAAAFTACSGSGKSVLKDGEYVQTSVGHNGPLTLQTTVKDKKITSVEVVQSSETKGIGGKAIDLMTQAAVTSNSVNIDGITGPSPPHVA